MITSRLLNFKARREGFVLIPYRDGAGWSIGCGHYLGPKHPGPRTITIPESIKLLNVDVAERMPRIEAAIKVPLADNKMHALLDLYYQGGNDGLDAVAAIINKRDPDDKKSCLTSDREAAREILEWDTSADGTHMEGLLKRRGLNVAMYTADEYGSDLDKIPWWDRVDEETGKARMKDVKWYVVQPGDFTPTPQLQKRKR